MSMDRGWRRLLGRLRADPARDVDDELAFHLAMRVEDFVRRGMSVEAARREAVQRFGDVDAVRGECHTIEHQREQAMSRARIFEELVHDVRFAVRALLRQPAFTIVATLTLALGIGANTAIFSVVNAFLFRPFPSPVADRLMVIAQTSRGEELAGSISYQNFLDIQGQKQIFDDALAWESELVNMRARGSDEGERRFVSFTSGSYFPMLAIRPAIGRLFSEEELRQRLPVVVLSYSLWSQRFGADPAIVGSQLTMNGIPFTIIGVAPEGFRGTQDVIDSDIFAPITSLVLIRRDATRLIESRTSSATRVWGLRRADVGVPQVRAALEVLARRIVQQYPDQPAGLRFIAELERNARPEISMASIMPWIAAVFMSLVGLVLLIACVNVANLMLARATARQSEIAVRSALGATRGRLMRQLLTESVVLALLGLGLGALIGKWVIGWMGGIRLSTDLPIRFDVAPDWRVAAFTGAIALLAGIITGLVPALHGTRGGVAHTLREASRGGGAGASRQRLRSMLVIAQVAVSLVLLVCAGLFTRSVRSATQVDLGFRPDHVLLASTDVAFQRYDSTRGVQFYRQLLERAVALPGVTNVALSQSMPLGFNNSSLDVYFDEDVPNTEKNRTSAWYDIVSPDYFQTLALPIVAGRAFTRFDTDSAPRVIIVSEAFVRRFFPGKDVIGRHVRFSPDGSPIQIVGVARDTKHIFISEDARPFVYRSAAQAYRSDMTLLVRTRGDAAAMIAPVRDVFRQIDHDLPIYDAKTMEQHLANGISLVFMRLAAVLAAAVGMLGLVQTVVGLYGVISYGVSQRTREFGIRMALGARTVDLIGGVVRQGAVLTAIGLAIGLAIAFGVTRLMTSLLVGVRTTDALTYGGAAAVLAILSLLSTYIPARRAARMQPVDALRSE